MKALIFILVVLCLQLSPTTASPLFFDTIFKVISNVGSDVTGSVAHTAVTAVNATTDVFSDTVDRLAKYTSFIPGIEMLTGGSSKVINKVENVIDTTVDKVANTTSNTAERISKRANIIIEILNSKIGAESEHLISFIMKVSNELTDISGNLTKGIPMPDHMREFLTKALNITEDLQEKFNIPDLSLETIANALNVSKDKIADILAGGPLNLPHGALSKFNKIVANISEFSPALGLLMLKYRLKFILAEGAVDAVNKGLIATGRTIGS